MTILNRLSDEYIIATKQPPESQSRINALQKFSPIDVPSDLLVLLSEVNELELFAQNDFYLRLWGADSCIEMNTIYQVQNYLSKALAFGDDGGGGAFIYLDGNDGFGVYYVRFADLDINEAIKISPSLFDLLVNGKGVDKLLSL